MNAEIYLKETGRRVDDALSALVTDDGAVAPRLVSAMRYSLLSGGKRLRPVLAIASAEMFDLSAEQVMPTACALEMIHTYSLIHDDLPCMDNDDLRRGRPTCHKVFGEATALLAGDGLLTEAFRVIARNVEQTGIRSEDVLRVISEVALACGPNGMVGGQVLDMEAEGASVSIDSLHEIHRHKTGCLLRTAVRSGAILGRAAESQLEKLTVYGEKIGLAFQIVDDILNETGDTKLLGKPVKSDAKHSKATFPSLLGLNEAKIRARDLHRAAVAALDGFDSRAEILKGLADFIIGRNF